MTATTALVAREWHFPKEEEQVPQWPPALNEFIEDDDDKEEERSESSQENLNVLHLLYTIAQVSILETKGAERQDQSHQDGFVHRGISCNKCHEEPIRGVRYHCLNCIDYDLCEYCEAEDAHFRLEKYQRDADTRTHTMIKIRVPTPSLVRRRPTELPMYPGPLQLWKQLTIRTNVERSSPDFRYYTIPTVKTRDLTYIQSKLY